MAVIIHMLNKAVFFDRDGTLNVDVGYLFEIEKFEWIEGAREAIKYCNDNSYLAIVVTNQSGIARGYYTEDDVKLLHNFMQSELSKIGAHIDAYYYCPHHPNGVVEAYSIDCECRKPKSKLLEMACSDFNIDRENSLMIGDSKRDVECAFNANIRGVLFEDNNLFTTLKNNLPKEN